MAEKELWKPVLGYEGLYEVSSRGRVRSLERKCRRKDGVTITIYGRMMRIQTDTYGYAVVHISKGGKHKTHRVHQMVLEAFDRPKPKELHGAHNNGNRKDNRIENLRWDTPSNNHRDRHRHGTDTRGERNANAKLTTEQVRAMRRKYADGGLTYRELADSYGVSYSAVGHAIAGRTWKDHPAT